MREHRRNLTRRQKIAATNAGLNPENWKYANENKLYFFLVGTGENAGKRVSVPKDGG